MVVRDIPWRILMKILRGVRNTFYKKEKPDRKQIVVTELSVEELGDVAQNNAHFEELEEYTYFYEGEILNLRRPAGVEDGHQMELHFRVFEHERGLEILVHYEISRFANPRGHLNGTIFSWDEGQSRLEEVFNDLGVQYEALS